MIATIIFLVIFVIGPILVLSNEVIYYCNNHKIYLKLQHAAWISLIILSLLGFLLLIFLYPLSVVLHNGCSLSKRFFTDISTFKAYPDRFSIDVASRIEQCIFGTGDMIKGIGLSQATDNITNFALNLDLFLENQNSDIDSKFNGILLLSNEKIQLIESYINGNNSLPDSKANDLENDKYSISNFTSWTDYSKVGSEQSVKGLCQASKDEWVFSSTRCTYADHWNSGMAVTDKIYDPLCIQIGDLNDANIESRYRTATSSCQTIVIDKIKAFFKGLKKYDLTRRSQFSLIKSKIESFKSQLQYVQPKVPLLRPQLINLKIESQDFIDGVIKTPNGLTNSMNCTVLISTVRKITDDICIGTLLPAYECVIFIILISFLSLLGGILAYIKACDSCEKSSEFNPSDYELAQTTIL